jgi:hypothetical protein
MWVLGGPLPVGKAAGACNWPLIILYPKYEMRGALSPRPQYWQRFWVTNNAMEHVMARGQLHGSVKGEGDKTFHTIDLRGEQYYSLFHDWVEGSFILRHPRTAGLEWVSEILILKTLVGCPSPHPRGKSSTQFTYSSESDGENRMIKRLKIHSFHLICWDGHWKRIGWEGQHR